MFGKSESKMIKGIGILFMFWLHLFSVDYLINNNNYYLSVFFKEDLFLVKIIARFCSVCVPLFLFVAGYGYYLSKRQNKFSLKAIFKKIYSYLWLVFIIFVPLLFVLGIKEFNIFEFILNFLGLSESYNGAWWFISLYIESFILMEIIFFIFKKIKFDDNKKYIFLALISFTFMLSGYGIKYFLGENTISKYLILNQLYTLLIKQPIFVSGYICAYKNIFKKVNYKFSFLLPLLLLLFVNIPESFYMPIIVPIVVGNSILIFNHSNIIKNVLINIGENSTFMWLTHNFLIYNYIQNIIYNLHYTVLVFLTLFVIDYIIAVVLKKIYHFILAKE